MSCRYSPPATDPAPSDPSAIACLRAARWPRLSRAVTRYLIFLVLRGQSLAPPASIGVLHIAKPIVEAAGAPLPEFELVGDDAIAAPPVGTRHRAVAVAALDALERVLEHLTAVDGCALPRRVDAQPAVERPRVEVRIRFDRADALDRPVDPHLALDGAPEEQEARSARRLHLARLPAPVVRVEDEPAVVHALEEHRADRWAAVR